MIKLVTFGSYIPLFGTSEGSISPDRGFKIEVVQLVGLPFLKVTKAGFDFIEYINFANVKGMRCEQDFSTDNARAFGNAGRGEKKSKQQSA